MADDTGLLRAAELDMLAEASRAAVELFAAVTRMREADAALSSLEPGEWNWGPVPAEWDGARQALADAIERVDAYKAFEPYRWWNSWEE
jgi:hypothetical protein